MTPEPPARRSPALPTAAPADTPAGIASTDPLFPLFLEVLRRKGHVTFLIADLGDDCGLVNKDRSAIVLDSGNDQAAMRATVAHELQHLACPDLPDEEIERMAAEMLVPLPDALSAAQVRGGVRAVAERLGVDPQLVAARIRSIVAEPDGARGVG